MRSWTITRLAEHHDRSSFDCGNAVLSDWLRRHANQFQSRDLARVYVGTKPDSGQVLGYYTLSTSQVRFEDLPSAHAKGLPRRAGLPSVLIGKMAVDRRVQRQGLGGSLLIDGLRRVEHLANRIGIRFVTLYAIDDEARDFYVHHQFVAFEDSPRHLFLPVHIIRQLGLGPLED